jgi:hypothetical protein
MENTRRSVVAADQRMMSEMLQGEQGGAIVYVDEETGEDVQREECESSCQDGQTEMREAHTSE